MKNIHLIPTDKPTGIFESNSGLQFSIMNKVRTGPLKGFHIYITSDEKIKEEDYWYDYLLETVNKGNLVGIQRSKKIILTTDQDLINDGVQAIDDEFLEWFIKNPSCEEIKTYIVKLCRNCGQQYCDNRDCRGYIDEPQYLISFSENTTQRIVTYCDGYEVSTEKIIISKEEPKQHVELINNSIDEFDEQIIKFKEKQKEILIQMMKDDKESGLYANSETIIMKDKEKIALLQKCFEDTIWMAIRYAHGRGTYAPGMVRDAVRDFKKVFPDWEPKEDVTIKPPTDDDLRGIFSRQHYLDDLFKK